MEGPLATRFRKKVLILFPRPGTKYVFIVLGPKLSHPVTFLVLVAAYQIRQ